MGLDRGSDSLSPFCSFLSRNPASRRASPEKGGVWTSPWSQTRGLSSGFILGHYMSHLTYCQVWMRAGMERTQRGGGVEGMEIRGSTGILGSAPPGRSCPSPGLPPALGARRSENRGDLVGCKGREVSPRAGRGSYAAAPAPNAPPQRNRSRLPLVQPNRQQRSAPEPCTQQAVDEIQDRDVG